METEMHAWVFIAKYAVLWPDAILRESNKFQSYVDNITTTKINKSPGFNYLFFLRSESKEQCAIEAISADTDEDLSSDSCSNTEDIQPEGAARPAKTRSL